jgi:hypothetical protein
VLSESTAGSGNYNVRLPIGYYSLVASAEGEDTINNDFQVEKDTLKTAKTF